MAQPGEIEIQVVSPSPPHSPTLHLARNSKNGLESGSLPLPHYTSPDIAQDFSRGKRRRKKKERKKRKDFRGHGDSGSPSSSHNTSADISESSRKLKWYTALREENCVAAMELLHECPKLAWQGWKVDPEMEGFDSSYPRRRTALLVGARRGCPALVKMILAIFQDEEGKGDDLLQGGVEDLLIAKDPRYELDALDIARFHGNREIISVLSNTSLESKANPYEIQDPVEWQGNMTPADMLLKDQLRHITEEVMMLEADNGLSLKQEYMLDYNFNFLPWEEYLFSFSCGSSYSQSFGRYSLSLTERIWWKVVKKSSTLRDFHLQDGLGRTALHVAVESDRVSEFVWDYSSIRGSLYSLRDGVGRTPLDWAAALGKEKGLDRLLEYGVNVLDDLESEMGVPLQQLDSSDWSSSDCSSSDFSSGDEQECNDGGESVGQCYQKEAGPKIHLNSIFSPLRLAIIHNHVKCVDIILQDARKKKRLLSHYFPFHWILCKERNGPPTGIFSLGALQLATILGHAPMVRLLLENGTAADKGSLRQHFKIIILTMLKTINAEKVAASHFALTRWIPRNLQEVFFILLVLPLLVLPLACIHKLLAVDESFYFQRETIATQQWLHSAIQIAAGSLRQHFKIIILTMLKTINAEKVAASYFALTRWIPRNLQEFFFILLVLPLLVLPLACIHKLLAVDESFYFQRETIATQQWLHSAIQIAAGCGKFGLIKTFLEHGHKHYDLFVKDGNGNNALHHVMLGMDNDYYGHQHFKFETKLCENVTLEQIIKTRERSKEQAAVEFSKEKGDKSKLAFVERQGCVELLLQGGFDPWIVNNMDEAPHPGEDAPLEFFQWWFDKLTTETIAAQNTLNAAAIAISVTAALVALVENSLVKVFIIFDAMSFFFSVSAIMMAIIPSIPIPRQSARIKLQRTRRIVNIAVGLLFPAIVFVLIAFAAASIAIIPHDHETWKYGGLTMTSAAISGLPCLCVIFLFSIRLLVVADRSPRIRSFYDTLRF